MKMNRRQFLRLAIASGGLLAAKSFLERIGLTQEPTPTPELQPQAYLPVIFNNFTYPVEITLYQAIHGGPWRSDEPNLGNSENPPILVVNGRCVGPDSDGKYRLRNFRRGDPIKLEFDPESLGGFRYGTPNSNSEVWRLKDGYGFTVDPDKLEILFGLMEGFLTLPIDLNAPQYVFSFVDLDPDMGAVMNYKGDRDGCGQDHVGTCDQHQGIDFWAPIGTPIYVIAPGIVLHSAPNENCEYPRYVRIMHEILGCHNYGPVVVEVFVSEYGHNSRNDVVSGQRIPRGTQIALSGNHMGDGRPPCIPHLHFGFFAIPENYWNNPVDYIFNHLPKVTYTDGNAVSIVVDPYRCAVDNPPIRFNPQDYPLIPESYIRSPGYWTVTNDPQGPVV